MTVPEDTDSAATAPAFAVGIPASASEPDVAGTLASVVASAERAGSPYEIVVAVNGPGGADAAAARDAAGFASGGSPRGDVDAPGTRASVRVLRIAEQSKVAAWNAIRAAARAPIIVFTDADVRLDADAIPRLLARLTASPELAAVAGREVASLGTGDGLVARLAALPYRFDFANVPGRLYALRTAALPDAMPPHVLHEDAYLSVRLGRRRFVKVDDAIVYLRPPTTWREYVGQRVRNELGKLQLAAEFPDLLRVHGFGVTPWRAFLRGIALREYPLVALSLATRAYARLAARRRSRAGFGHGWDALPTTKTWR